MDDTFFTVAPTASLKEARKVMKENGVSQVLVVDKDRLQGILGEDKLKEIESRPALANNAWEREYQFRYKKVEEVMQRDPVTVAPDTSLEEALEAAGRDQVAMLPVVDKGKVVGMVTGDRLSGFSGS
jgi:acetoin utilization protein AcuB